MVLFFAVFIICFCKILEFSFCQDTGVSVRKRVIKILKDICMECPEFPKIPEICVKMIRRVNDEEGNLLICVPFTVIM
jgi:hypothetical protein